MARANAKPSIIKVVVSRNERAARAIDERPLLAVIPDRDNWNDYNYRQYASLILFSDDGEETPFKLRLMFEDQTSTHGFLTAQLEKWGDGFALDTVDVRYCAMFSEVTGYRDLVEALGFDEAIGALRRLRDVVLARIESEDNDILELMTGDPFHLGMVRIASRCTAFRRGGRYLRPTPIGEISDAAASFGIKAELPAYNHPVHLDLDGSL